MKPKIHRAVWASLFLLAVTGCAAPFVRSELYFGTARAGMPDVSPAEWQKFVDEVITPRFPNGLTILDGAGQWRMSDGSLAKEKSHLVIVVHSPTVHETQKLDEIREAYKQRFNQEAVLEIDEDVRIKF